MDAAVVDVPHGTTVAYFTDIEGDYESWIAHVDNSRALWRAGDGSVRLEDGFHFVYGGDAVDHMNGDLRVVRALLRLHDDYPGRVHLILGNRDINKLRFPHELSPEQIDGLPLADHPGVFWLPGSKRPSASGCLTREQLDGNTAAARLRWILADTMNCGKAFDYRREELAILRGCTEEEVTDDDVVQSFRDESTPPHGCMYRYARVGKIAAVIGDALFVHAGVPRLGDAMIPGPPPPSGEGPLLPLREWAKAVNKYAADAVDRVDAASDPPAAEAGPAATRPWCVTGGYEHPHPGSALCQYGMMQLPGDRQQPSPVYTGLLDHATWVPVQPGKDVLKWFADAGVKCVLVGHLPQSDCPAVLRYETFAGIMCDTSYSGCVRWDGVEPSEEHTATGSRTRRRGPYAWTATSEVLVSAGCDTVIHGRLATGQHVEAKLSDPLIGRTTADGWRVHSRLLGDGTKLVMYRNEGYMYWGRIQNAHEVEFPAAPAVTCRCATM